ncbi:hypothetical protein VTJ04DRAFT_9187 [Mycothermus thermophilus]|uniref:uncharacterized protein n=1 Tax=Humicola insolens TaxID=85995 RepID=UPI003742FE74
MGKTPFNPPRKPLTRRHKTPGISKPDELQKPCFCIFFTHKPPLSFPFPFSTTSFLCVFSLIWWLIHSIRFFEQGLAISASREQRHHRYYIST